jgi:hypothetical protein
VCSFHDYEGPLLQLIGLPIVKAKNSFTKINCDDRIIVIACLIVSVIGNGRPLIINLHKAGIKFVGKLSRQFFEILVPRISIVAYVIVGIVDFLASREKRCPSPFQVVGLELVRIKLLDEICRVPVNIPYSSLFTGLVYGAFIDSEIRK